MDAQLWDLRASVLKVFGPAVQDCGNVVSAVSALRVQGSRGRVGNYVGKLLEVCRLLLTWFSNFPGLQIRVESCDLYWQ